MKITCPEVAEETYSGLAASSQAEAGHRAPLPQWSQLRTPEPTKVRPLGKPFLRKVAVPQWLQSGSRGDRPPDHAQGTSQHGSTETRAVTGINNISSNAFICHPACSPASHLKAALRGVRPAAQSQQGAPLPAPHFHSSGLCSLARSRRWQLQQQAPTEEKASNRWLELQSRH